MLNYNGINMKGALWKQKKMHRFGGNFWNWRE